jgi:rhamnosyltransferase
MKTSMAVETTTPASIAQATCAVIVTYHPDSGLFDRVARVAKQVAETVIVDNGSPESSVQQIRKIAEALAVHLILNTSNTGLARALNEGTRWAASQGFRWILTLDQDTLVSPDMVDTLAAVAGGYRNPERLAVIGSNYRYKVNGRLFREEFTDAHGFPAREMTSVLTSGSLVSIDAFQTIGGFRDDLFIDCVDHEYCLRSRAWGFHVLLTSKPVMEHDIGYLTEHRLLGRRVGTSNHSPVRQYFMARNSILLIRDYLAQEPRWILKYSWDWLKSIVLILLFEKDRIPKMKNLMRGCLDGLLARTSSLK